MEVLNEEQREAWRSQHMVFMASDAWMNHLDALRKIAGCSSIAATLKYEIDPPNKVD